MCFVGGGRWDRPRSLNSIIKFYGVASTMARGGVGDRTTAVVFRHLASFSELSQRKEVWIAEQVRSGKRAQEIREWVVGEWWKNEARNQNICAQCTPLWIDFCYNTVLTVSNQRKTWCHKNLKWRSNKINRKLIYCLYKFNNKWFPSFQ